MMKAELDKDIEKLFAASENISGKVYFKANQRPPCTSSEVFQVFINGKSVIRKLCQITKFKTKRYKDKTLENFTGHFSDYRSVNGMKVPFYFAFPTTVM